ncbi:MAG: matrixin family metalloprotease [Cyanobacteria bacterium J06600_6]
MNRLFTNKKLLTHRLILIARAFIVGLAIAFCSFITSGVNSQAPDTSNLPPAKVHALPLSLAKWNSDRQENYFEEIESTPLGYLVWTNLPIKVYVDSVEPANTAANQRFQQWTTAAKQAIAEWNVYLPLEEVQDKQQADITIMRSQPKREIKLNSETGLYDIPRAVAAQTNYKFYLTENYTTIAMGMTINVSPNFTGVSLLGTMRHELGHALGLWGHSPNKNDALYFSQVSNPPTISKRDLNTLKKIYQQPTRLGWKIP